jgi:hypothetical protein
MLRDDQLRPLPNDPAAPHRAPLRKLISRQAARYPTTQRVSPRTPASLMPAAPQPLQSHDFPATLPPHRPQLQRQRHSQRGAAACHRHRHLLPRQPMAPLPRNPQQSPRVPHAARTAQPLQQHRRLRAMATPKGTVIPTAGMCSILHALRCTVAYESMVRCVCVRCLVHYQC